MSSGRYVVVLGFRTGRLSLQKALRDLCRECRQLQLEPIVDGELRQAFPEAAQMTFFRLRIAPPEQTGLPVADAGSFGLVSNRHTPTAVLRRIVARAATRFGAAQLLVRHCDTGLCGCRSATTTLAGFLRSGRVIQDDLLLSVRPRATASRRRAAVLR